MRLVRSLTPTLLAVESGQQRGIANLMKLLAATQNTLPYTTLRVAETGRFS
ncbi:hypothetical protein MGWOODY_Clf2669 [hydrothermal vent metagenome]|uniref:Uncharacterized protein n=1 Tax=hydrothermal vent metagenome TaxID=652676 RepID=A0A160VDW8_9ZZZZ